ncbi:pyridoxal-phosphate dependent enzyme [Kribbella sp. VKM Ac-2566]|uniref:threonine synthase n=1 Tax=Kribbella sp. VKM Ac-2566 TaxID=2512218 RepID=UPI0010628475|nr:pyridoxal-phosphate dependent enzyme [Kribbella sp. VKM Ac-2566]
MGERLERRDEFGKGRLIPRVRWVDDQCLLRVCQAGTEERCHRQRKSIAYELARDLGSEVDAVVVPTSGADVLSGIERGYRELHAAGLVGRVPRLVAAETETGAPFAAALALVDRAAQERVVVRMRPSPAFSIGSSTPTWQGLNALWRTGGEAIAVSVSDYLPEYQRLPATTGVFLEPSSVVALVAARLLLRRDPALRIVALGTGSGLKSLSKNALREPAVAGT